MQVVLHHPPQERHVPLGLHRFQPDHVHVAQMPEATPFVQHEREAATHPRREVAPRRAEHHHDTAGHVLAAVVADPSTTARAPELRTANRSPAKPRKYASPAVAP